MTTIAINLEDELKKQVEEKAKELQIDASEFVVKAIKEFFYFERVNQLRNDLGEHARKQGFQSEEDIFREVS